MEAGDREINLHKFPHGAIFCPNDESQNFIPQAVIKAGNFLIWNFNYNPVTLKYPYHSFRFADSTKPSDPMIDLIKWLILLESFKAHWKAKDLDFMDFPWSYLKPLQSNFLQKQVSAQTSADGNK